VSKPYTVRPLASPVSLVDQPIQTPMRGTRLVVQPRCLLQQGMVRNAGANLLKGAGANASPHRIKLPQTGDLEAHRLPFPGGAEHEKNVAYRCSQPEPPIPLGKELPQIAAVQ